MRRYCSLVPNFLAFRTPHESGFLVFGVSNAKYLAFDIPDESALIGYIPSSIENLTNLEWLDLSFNNLSGTIPKCLVDSTALSLLNLRMNSLYSTSPTTFAIRNNFRSINLNSNQSEGPLSPSLAILIFLMGLIAIAYNQVCSQTLSNLAYKLVCRQWLQTPTIFFYWIWILTNSLLDCIFLLFPLRL